jgi:hypothetical protein
MPSMRIAHMLAEHILELRKLMRSVRLKGQCHEIFCFWFFS